jgi:hypothetical protein
MTTPTRVTPTHFDHGCSRDGASVEKLSVATCNGAAKNIEQRILVYMPNICEISFGGGRHSGHLDEDMATILDGSRAGLKVVKVKPNSQRGRPAMDALVKHISTLKVLDVDGIEEEPTDLVQVPRSCAKLHTLSLPQHQLLSDVRPFQDRCRGVH